MPHKSNLDSATRARSNGKCQGNKQAGKDKEIRPSNPWPYKETLPILSEHDKCSLMDLAMLSCRPNFEIKPLPAQYTKKSQDDDLYHIFGGLLNQCENETMDQVLFFNTQRIHNEPCLYILEK